MAQTLTLQKYGWDIVAIGRLAYQGHMYRVASKKGAVKEITLGNIMTIYILVCWMLYVFRNDPICTGSPGRDEKC